VRLIEIVLSDDFYLMSGYTGGGNFDDMPVKSESCSALVRRRNNVRVVYSTDRTGFPAVGFGYNEMDAQLDDICR